MVAGQWFEIYNGSTGSLNLQYNGGATFGLNPTVSPASSIVLKLVNNGTSSGTWALQSSGSGSGSGSGKNYLTAYTASTSSSTPNPGNGNFENGSTTGWSLAHSTLSANFVPTSTATAGTAFSSSSGGTAASGNLSLGVVSSGQLAGSYSGQLASSAVSTAGDMMISSAFFIDSEDKAKLMTINLAYLVTGGNLSLNFSGTSSNSFAIYMYDVTNAVWIQPIGVYSMSQVGSVAAKIAPTFQTSANGIQYQLAIVNINASAGAYAMTVDDFAVGPSTSPGYGMIGSDPVLYTPTLAGFGTPTNVNITWSRIGKYLIVQGYFNSGTTTSANATISLPTGLVTDSTYSSNGTVVGHSATNVTASTYFSGLDFIAIPGNNYINFSLESSTAPGTSFVPANNIASSGQIVEINFMVAIQGWSSQSQVLSQYDGRVLGFSGSSTNVTASSGSPIAGLNGVIQDTHGGWNNTTGVYTIPISGWYDVSGDYSVGAIGGSTYSNMQISFTGSQSSNPINGPFFTISSSIGVNGLAAGKRYLVAGDTVSFIPDWNGSGTGSGDVSLNVSLLSGAQQIVAGQKIEASYYTSTNVGVGVGSQVNFDTKEFDTTGAVVTGTSWAFTAPVSGTYLVTVNASTPSTVGTLILYKNGTLYKSVMNFNINSNYHSGNGAVLVQLVAGDVIDLRVGVSSVTIYGGNLYDGNGSNINIKQVN